MIAWRPYQRDADDANRAYRVRIASAIVISALLHAAAVGAYWNKPVAEKLSANPKHDPLVLNLQPEPAPQPAREFIDAAVPTEEPPVDANRIAEVDAQASDTMESEGANDMPAAPQGRIEQAGISAAPPAQPAPPPTPLQETEPDMEEEAEVEEAIEEDPAPSEERIEVAANTPRQPQLPVQPPTPSPQPAQPSPTQEPKPPQPDTRVDREAQTQTQQPGDAPSLGFTGFEALHDELAPYMKEVRNAVERRWKIAVQLKYSGTDPADAIIDCAIAPTGELVSAEVADPGNSVRFALLCKDAIEAAAPFPPFPFEVPPMYKNDLLRIRWTFSFL